MTSAVTRAQVLMLIVTALGAVAAAMIGGWRDAYSVAAGGVLLVGNLAAYRLLARPFLRRVARDGGAGQRSALSSGAVLAALVFLKMGLLCGIVWALVRYGLVAPVAFVLGLSALPIGAALSAVIPAGGRAATATPDSSGANEPH